MANIQHKDITDPNIHEPKGIGTASADQVYVATGLGGGTWKTVDTTLTPYMEFTFSGTARATGLVPLTFTTARDASIGVANNTNRLSVTRTGIYLINLDLIMTTAANAAEQVAVSVRANKALASQSPISAFFKAVSATESSSTTVTKEDVRSAALKLTVGDELGFWLTRVGVQAFSTSVSGVLTICRIGSE